MAVAGNPNSGKSTLINAIAGTKLHVGNWSGVTVEKKQATFKHGDLTLDLVDLPGTYSLSPYSQEEIIAADYLSEQKPDVILDVVDATNLERNLYLTVQLLELGIPMVLALNICDEAQKMGLAIDAARIGRALGVRVVATSALSGSGLGELLDTLADVASDLTGHAPQALSYGEEIDAAVKTIGCRLAADRPALGERYPARWLAMKLLEGDERVIAGADLPDPAALVAMASAQMRAVHGEDLESTVAEARYAQATRLTREVMTRPLRARIELTERIDQIILHRHLGIPIFLAAMWLLFKLMFDVSSPYVDWFGGIVDGPVAHLASAGLEALGTSGWLVSLIVDGIIGGVGIVVSFLPIILTMMFFITLLEASGYMARAAFIMDRSMRAIGLHGKSFIPLLLGFGCNVPAVYATRTLENPKDKVLTSLLIPFMSCGARLPVYVVFTSVFFARGQATVLWSLYLLGLAVAMGLGLIFKKTLFPGEAPAFVMELPPYRMPSLRSLLVHTWEKGKHYAIKAGTYIVAASVIVWLLHHMPWGTVDKRDTYLGRAGAIVAPAFAPMGFGNWQAGASLIAGLAAKEVVVATMAQIYAPARAGGSATAPAERTFAQEFTDVGVGFLTATRDAATGVFSGFGVTSLSTETPKEGGSLAAPLRAVFTPLSAYAFLVFVLLYVPCMVVLASMRQEFDTWKWPIVSTCVSLGTAWVVSFLVFQVGSLLEIGVR